ncbi:peptide chain release factor N(5)-glutamine methyltransferase [Arsenicitalea aurantiaca]|uniref:peptide chain release factor N(5)-glutamine methyltransferase n=1 Tax=Arsenicitalea aurantiaca TaxID=1783274 RepID=UPI001FCF1742|nr:peptide chain release factor N(5)-glutamine methyltransferase [Arsenicitalea aurantiaca]
MRDRFRAAGLPTPELDARLLAEKAFGLGRLALVQHEAEIADPAALARLDALAEKRLAGMPVERLLGEKGFYGRSFALSPDTLGPRPETEMLVEIGLGALGGKAAPRILDLGTGSGAIIVSLLAERPDANGVATDLSPGAIEAARANAGRHGVLDRLALRHGSWFAPMAADERFALIVSNPPYIETDAILDLGIEVREHDPLLALDGGPDGLDAYRTILEGARAHLEPGAPLLVEIGSGQGDAVSALFVAAGFAGVAVRKDLAGLDRVVIGHHF